MRRALLGLRIVVTVALLGGVLAAVDLPALGRSLQEASLDEMEQLWIEAKQRERGDGL